MSCIHATVCWPSMRSENHVHRQSQSTSIKGSNNSSPHKFQHKKPLLRIRYVNLMHNRCAPICAFDGKGNSEGDKEAFSWDSLKKAMDGFRDEPSVQDLLRKQMQEQELGGDGGDRNFPPDDGDGSGDSEGESFAGIWDEFAQVILATTAFIFVYVYMIRGEELIRLAKDYIKYRLGAGASYRLKRATRQWQKFYRSIVRTEVVREDWLEHAIVTTPTWWHKPKELARRMIAEDSFTD